ncbi:hypothetical protein Tcan_02905 [Toxocara canis]|uniref:Uncharacterized protein n=1 Tax=Toxocara canis TaxID=6265 RepID=A0A0B2UZL9_TOXCA|nr:hypothetical protein Tcan_02905 [Toxocara canis]
MAETFQNDASVEIRKLASLITTTNSWIYHTLMKDRDHCLKLAYGQLHNEEIEMDLRKNYEPSDGSTTELRKERTKILQTHLTVANNREINAEGTHVASQSLTNGVMQHHHNSYLWQLIEKAHSQLIRPTTGVAAASNLCSTVNQCALSRGGLGAQRGRALDHAALSWSLSSMRVLNCLYSSFRKEICHLSIDYLTYFVIIKFDFVVITFDYTLSLRPFNSWDQTCDEACSSTQSKLRLKSETMDNRKRGEWTSLETYDMKSLQLFEIRSKRETLIASRTSTFRNLPENISQYIG